MNWIKEQYRLAHEFYRDHVAVRFYIVLAVFLALSAGCYFGLRAAPELAQQIFDAFAEMVKDIAVSESGTVSALSLLGNNARSAAVSILMGFLPFFFLPALSVAVNAAVIGGVLAVSALGGAAVGPLVLWGLLPHGIFEIPAIMLAVAAGLWLCRNMCRTALKKSTAVPLERALPALLRFYVCVVLPLLIAAALIEGYVTPRLLAIFAY